MDQLRRVGRRLFRRKRLIRHAAPLLFPISSARYLIGTKFVYFASQERVATFQ
jgi:hypothetical protein